MIGSFFITAGLCISLPVFAAELTIDSQDRSIPVGETFRVEIRLNSEQQVINAVEAVINYPTDVVEAIEISRGGSFLTLWPDEPTINEQLGKISFTGGIPNGSTVFGGRVVTMLFKALQPGGAEIFFDKNDTSVLLNDGLGTPTTVSLVSGIYTVVDEEQVSIFSPTHPDQDTWYQNSVFTVQWSEENETLYSYRISDSPNKEPDNSQEPVHGEVSFSNLQNGVHYFVLKEKKQGGEWRIVGIRRALVDTEPPLPIEIIKAEDPDIYGGKAFIAFSANDEHSGISHFTITEGGNIYQNITSPHALKEPLGDFILTAYDKAGNSMSYKFKGAALEGWDAIEYPHVILYGAAIIVIIFGAALIILVRYRK